jgi:ferrous-iron efflux pump FieF
MSNATKGSESARLLKLATYASVLTATLLIGAKLVAWLLTGSVTVLASLVDSTMDAGASIINLVAVHYALKPADAEHRFGHGKAESLAGLAQATFIAGSAVFLTLHAVERLLRPVPLGDLGVGIGVMAFAILATLALLALQRHVIKRTGSTAIRADSLHYTTDLLTNAGTVVALLLAQVGWAGLDPVFALAIAGYILYSAWHIGYDAFQLLLDRELDPEIRDRIRALALKDTRVRGLHDLRTRSSGQTTFVQVHLELDEALSLGEAHAIGDAAEARIREALPEAEIMIHQDPVHSSK